MVYVIHTRGFGEWDGHWDDDPDIFATEDEATETAVKYSLSWGDKHLFGIIPKDKEFPIAIVWNGKVYRGVKETVG